MKPSAKKNPPERRKAVVQRERKPGPAKTDELGIERGQNGEKGNTSDPRHIRDMKEAAH